MQSVLFSKVNVYHTVVFHSFVTLCKQKSFSVLKKKSCGLLSGWFPVEAVRYFILELGKSLVKTGYFLHKLIFSSILLQKSYWRTAR